MARPAPPDLSDSRRPLRGVARNYPAGHRVDAHEHAWGQVLYAVSGMMWLETPDEALPVPPQRAVWLPPGLRHAVRVASELQMRNIYLSPELSRGLEDRTLVLVVGPLLRELIVSLVEQERQSNPDYYRALADLAVLELGRARRSSLRVPLPDASDRRLLALCQAVMANPSWTSAWSAWPKTPGPACGPSRACSSAAWAWASPTGGGRCNWRPPPPH